MADNSSVKVAVRIRPLVNSEIERGCKDILEVYKELSQVHIKNSDKAFTYNYIFDSKSTHVDLYKTCIQDMIPNLFQGFNLTILAYGQTGSGKTYSMGTAYNGEDEMGVIPRSVKQIFEFVKDNFTCDFNITVSFLELYQEILYDLLSEKPRDQCSLDIREDYQKGIHIPGLTEIPVTSASEVINCLTRGSSGRATASTNMNSQSSRSHAIFTINICMQSKTNCNENKTAKFHLVDLAGSERPKKTGAVGNTFREGVNINKGLLVLGNVISALGEEKQQENRFIPYRDSNLTRLLKDSLGGNSITLMIACVSPADYNIDETLSTLRYADRARKIKNKPIVNQDPQAAQINDLKKTVKILQLQLIGQGGPVVSSDEIFKLKQELNSLQSKNRDLTIKLSSALNDKANLLEKYLHLQNANEEFTQKMGNLKETINETMKNVTIAMENGKSDSFKSCQSEFDEIKKQFEELDKQTKKTEAEIKIHETDMVSVLENNSFSEDNAKEINDVNENFATRQIELNDQLKDVMKNLALKELLAKDLAKNLQSLVDYDTIRQNEVKIEALEKEKNSLELQLKNAQQNGPNKLSEDRRKRVKELECHIQDLKKKLSEQNRLIRLKEKDEFKIKQLNQEILQMKQNKVKLVRSMKEESERFRTWKSQREKELTKLKNEDVKKKRQIQKMQDMHLKQQNVLKRKVEEAVAANKRLKVILSTRKEAQEQKFNGKLEKVTSWLKQELEILLSFTEIEVSLEGLLEDRALLQKQLDVLKSDSNPNLYQIRSIEEDIELRSVQIQDMQQKLLDADEDVKNGIKLENIQTMAEAKHALKVLINEAVDIRRKMCKLKIKSLEYDDGSKEEKRKLNFEKKLKERDEQHALTMSNLEKDYQEKIAILLSQLRGIDMKTSSPENENLQEIIRMLQKKLEELENRLQEKTDELEEVKRMAETKTLVETNETKKEIFQIPDLTNTVVIHRKKNVEFKDETTPPKKVKALKTADETFTVPDDGEKENFGTPVKDASFDFEDDPDKDPDWRKTPIGRKVWADKKRLRENIKSMTKIDDTDTEVLEIKAPKRSSDGGCTCKTNCSKRCGCRKTGKECSSTCKCNKFSCTNLSSKNEDIEELDDSEGFKRPRMKL